MAKYTSKYAELAFRVNGARKKFSGGTFETDSKADIEVLDKLIDTIRVDEPKEEKPKEKMEETKPTPKKTSGAKKSSKK